ncbi:WecB/TagA/CpsF family glycosyltransferase, partial [Akkermansia sp.]
MNENRMETYFSIRYEFDRERVFQRMDGVLRSGGKGYICVADGHVLSEVQRNREYRKVLGGALLTICDSGWVPVYLKWLLHADRPQYCGAQIFHDVIAMKKYRMMFLGGTRDTLDALRRTLVREDPRVGYMPFEELPFCAADEFDYGAIAARINEYLPDIIWISLGAPKQEVFMNRLCPHLQRGIMVAVGAVFHFAAGGRIRRAPDWMVACKLEFLYRIFNEPRKQMKRCWKIISVLPWIFIREKQRQKAARPGDSSGWGGETPRLPCTLVSCFG